MRLCPVTPSRVRASRLLGTSPPPRLTRLGVAVLAGVALAASGLGGLVHGPFAMARAAVPPALVGPAVPPVGVDCAQLQPTSLNHNIPWPQGTLDFQRVWPLTEGAGIIVAVVDTGVDGQQPFLRGAVLPGIDVRNAAGGAANTDCDGHGTFVAGIIAGRQQPGFGFRGVAPEVKILPVREANSATDPGADADILARGIRAAVNRGALVINVSIVTTQPALQLAQAVQYALDHNVVIVAAAGNDFSQGNQVQYPAGFPGVLAVGAVDQSGQRASFSETGPNVAIVAPGVNLLGPGAGGTGLVTAPQAGTSFATPYVAGVAALVRAYYPQLTAAQVIHRLEVTADHPPGALPNSQLGWGEVNPYAALTAVLPGEQVTAPAAAPPSPAAIKIPVQSSAGAQDATDVAGAAAAATALAILVLLSGGVVRRGRARGWRPGT
ncbi:MAG: type VII secretion-associated serine protease mycosin [Streptosporangiaceae bacterium]